MTDERSSPELRRRFAFLTLPAAARVDWLTLAIVAVACIAALVNARVFATTEVDDAYITFRYADNLAHGLGPTYNPGEHVEGTSSFLLMLLLALPMRLGADPLATARLLGTGAFVGMVILAYVTAASLSRRWPRALGAGAAAVVCASTSLAFHADTGLETDVFAFLVMLALTLLVRDPERARERIGWAFAAGLASIARPEGPFLLTALFALEGARALVGRPSRETLAYLLRAAAAAGCLLGPMLIFRRAYYHAWVPNTVLAKSGSAHRFDGLGLAEALSLATGGEGFRLLREYAGHLGLGGVLALGGLTSPRTRFASIAALSIAATCALGVVWSDGDWMSHERMLTPAMAPMAVAIAIGIGALVERAPRGVGATALAGAAAALAFASLHGVLYEHAYRYPNDRTVDWMKGLGGTLRDGLREDDLLATDMGGRVPYYSHARTIEMFGLCDATIAAHGVPWARMGKTDSAYVIGRRPTFFMFNFARDARSFFRDPAFAGHDGEYWAVLTPGYLQGYGKIVFARRDRPDLDSVVASLGASLVEPGDEFARLKLP
jgi:hypothetical protein